ncbi:MAG: Brp/Blh family beta-carotene 15,15'-dioxygenase [Chloroflexota bacterium]
MIRIASIEAGHRPVFIGAALAAGLLAVLAAPGALVSGPALVIWAALIALVGLPHGAFDLRVARAAGLARGRASMAAVAVAYLAVAAGFGVLWKAAPAPWLVLFMVISAVHFSEDWAGELPWWGRFGAGWAILGLPALTHQGDVAQVFARLIPAEPAAAIAGALSVVALPGLAVAVLGALLERPRRPGVALELLAIAALAVALPPLLYFVAYFCGMHSLRQTLHTASRLGADTLGGAIRMAAPLTIVTVLGVAALLPWLGGSADEQVLRAVFVGLACLTVPHMALNLWVELGPPRMQAQAQAHAASQPMPEAAPATR